MAINDLLTGGAIAGVLAGVVGFWNQIKAFLWKIISIFVQKVEINTEEAHDAVTSYLIRNFKRLPMYDKVYGATNEAYRNGKYGLVPFEKFGTRSIIFLSNRKLRKWIPFLLTRSQPTSSQSSERGGQQQQQEKVFSSLLYLRMTLRADEIVQKAVQERNELFWRHSEEQNSSSHFDIFYLPNKETNNYSYYSKPVNNVAWYKQEQFRLLGVAADSLGRERSRNGRALDNLFFPQEVKDLITVIELWVKSEDWYREKNLPWKRGWLLYGPPGTGKTALARAFAEDMNMPIYVYSLSQMSNSELTAAWKRMQVNIPCVALIEDFDTVFDKRRNVSYEPGLFGELMRTDRPPATEGGPDGPGQTKFSPLTFDCFLNCLDGVEKSNGVFTIITTNDIGKIDEAIGRPVVGTDGSHTFVSTRPGRIDKAIELGFMDRENKKQMAEKLLNEFPERLAEVLRYIESEKEETPAQFQEYCSQIAIVEHWQRLDKESR